MNGTTTIHLVRHAEVHNPRQILYGRLPRFRLTEHGRLQADRCGRFLRSIGVDAIYSSPLLRARQTAAAIINHCGPMKMHISKRLNEVHTWYEGHPGTIVDEREGDIYTGVPARYEKPRDIVARTLAFIRWILGRHAGGRVAAVTHGDVVTFMVLWAMGRSLTPRNKTRLLHFGYPDAYPAHTSITTFEFTGESHEDKPAWRYQNPNAARE